MDLKTLRNTPPWEWPEDATRVIQKVLADRGASESDRLEAAGFAGDLIVMNDTLADSLLAVLSSSEEPESLRATAAISFGPVLEQSDIDGFEDTDDIPITERTFRKIQKSLHRLYLDTGIPKEVRRRILEASVRAPENWHEEAIRTAYGSGDRDWLLTAVFAMRWVRGFDDKILAALKSLDPEIQCEAVKAAGNWDVKAAGPHVVALVNDSRTPKPLLLAAIGAAAEIHPAEVRKILGGLEDSPDDEIAEAAGEAIALAEAISANEDYEEDDEEEPGSGWVN